jgi:hypothetical protein
MKSWGAKGKKLELKQNSHFHREVWQLPYICIIAMQDSYLS